MKIFIRILWTLCILSFMSSLLMAKGENPANLFFPKELPCLPNALKGAQIGICEKSLILAGGYTKEFESTSDIYILHTEKSEWKKIGSLTEPVAFTAKAQYGNGFIIAGGLNGATAVGTVSHITFKAGKLEIKKLPHLPVECYLPSATVLNDKLYVFGGVASDGRILNQSLVLDLKTQSKWEQFERWPGQPIAGAIAASRDNAIYLFGGFSIAQDGYIIFSKNCYRYGTGPDWPTGWKSVANIPVTAAAIGGVETGSSHILLLTGDQEQANQELTSTTMIKPASESVLYAYHTYTDTWTKMPISTLGRSYAPAAWWNETFVLAGGIDAGANLSADMPALGFTSEKAAFGFLDFAGIGAYILGMVGIAIYIAFKKKNTEHYFVGNRNMPWFAVGVSMFACGVSAIAIMALPAKSFATNWVFATIYIINFFVMMPFYMFVFIPILQKLKVTTTFQYLEERFNRPVRMYCSVVYVIMQMVVRMNVVLLLPGIAINAVTGLNIYVAIILAGIICTLYTAAGGIEAVIWTDLLQAAFLIGSVLISIIVVLIKVDGGLMSVIDLGMAESKFRIFDTRLDFTLPTIWVFLIMQFCLILGAMQEQENMQRILSTSSIKNARKTVFAFQAINIPAFAMFFFFGTALFAFYKLNPQLLNPGLRTDAIVPWFISQQLPAGIAGLAIAGIFAASLSTLNGGINSASTIIVTDFIKPYVSKVSEVTFLKLAKIMTFVVGMIVICLACFTAKATNSSLWDLTYWLTGLIGGTIGGIYAIAILLPRAGALPTFIGAFSGILMPLIMKTYTNLHFLLYSASAMVTCLTIAFVSSHILPKCSKNLDGLTLFTLMKKTKKAQSGKSELVQSA